MDETGRPLYGDVFGLDAQEGGGLTNDDDETLDKTLWGELESEEEESEEVCTRHMVFVLHTDCHVTIT